MVLLSPSTYEGATQHLRRIRSSLLSPPSSLIPSLDPAHPVTPSLDPAHCSREFKDVFPRYQQKDPTYNSLPSEEDWKKVHLVCAFLEELNEVTHIISSFEYPTSNLFLLELYNIKKLLNDTKVDEDIAEKDVQDNTQKEISSGSSILSGKGNGKVRAQYANYIKNVNSVQQVKSELEVYFEERVVFCEDDHEFDALS
ncbi:hypothetical protein ZIOFF_006658 [Zingiber officinale]|uniref:Uncharacterized protein n=1 Tax=Zingiber officinale TaxID=94328 RepID=A0A8J5HZQ0_ZINOF|nr:hypothetical protein ZIOFF_006658 [Zingiber officinale]